MTMKAQQAAPAASEAGLEPRRNRQGGQQGPRARAHAHPKARRRISVDWRHASDEEFTRGFNEMMQKRRGRY